MRSPEQALCHHERPSCQVVGPIPMAQDTIAAVATAPGCGAIGIVRVSGPGARAVAMAITGRVPQARTATLATFSNQHGEAIDQGMVIFFEAPASYTSEDCLELQGHGGHVVLNQVLEAVLACGVRLAQPGEFTKRAFRHGKLNLLQAEAVVDLIHASTPQAALAASRSLRGVFADAVYGMAEMLAEIRSTMEAAIDFAEDMEAGMDIIGAVRPMLQALVAKLAGVLSQAREGQAVAEGVQVVLVGEPNAGKSSLFNRLSDEEAAIVTAMPGTTRDALLRQILLGGMLIHLTDTAGLASCPDPIEALGIEKTTMACRRADLLLAVASDDVPFGIQQELVQRLLQEQGIHTPVIWVRNKIDLTGSPATIEVRDGACLVYCSALRGAGMDLLRQAITDQLLQGKSSPEPAFAARRRHVEALTQVKAFLEATDHFLVQGPLELAAEQLRQAQVALGEIVGESSNEELLERIFSSFCIGK